MNYDDPSGHVAEFFASIREWLSNLFGIGKEKKPASVEEMPIQQPEPTQEETENYLEIQQSLAENKKDIEECIQLSVFESTVEGYNVSYVIDFIAKLEHFSATPYYATEAEKEDGRRTIGYGHLIKEEEEKMYPSGYTMTEDEAKELLKKDILENFPSGVMDKVLEVHGPLTQNQLDALVALRFNNGYFNPVDSPKFTDLLVNTENYTQEKEAIVAQFMTYTKQDDETLGGLVKRSTAEAIMFFENEYFTEYDDLYAGEVIDVYEAFLEKYGQEDKIEYLR